ncbi:MAG: hypothetical protein QOH97_5389 [Actinoplanes sp.]|nr:hypothetical protein [Actinoplanes sp.]
MYRTPCPTFDCLCDCRCRIHHSQPRTTYDNPDCHCLITCASQPMTLLAPQINDALFLHHDGELWHVPGLEPGHWDWRYAAPIGAGTPCSTPATPSPNSST